MKLAQNIQLVNYTKGEELLHVLTHAAGLVLSVFIILCCLVPSLQSHDVLRSICAFLYLFGTTVMFLTSSFYHGVKPSNAKRMLRLLDHCMIFFAVAGTATACVPPVFETAGKTAALLMGVCAWIGAACGLCFTLLSFEKTKGIQMALYIGTAAVCAVSGAKAFTVLPRGAFHCFLGGSTALLIGAVLYGLGKRVRYMHAVFHLCIDLGLTIYFIGIQRYCF